MDGCVWNSARSRTIKASFPGSASWLRYRTPTARGTQSRSARCRRHRREVQENDTVVAAGQIADTALRNRGNRRSFSGLRPLGQQRIARWKQCRQGPSHGLRLACIIDTFSWRRRDDAASTSSPHAENCANRLKNTGIHEVTMTTVMRCRCAVSHRDHEHWERCEAMAYRSTPRSQWNRIERFLQ
jgi:hypothetical protein